MIKVILADDHHIVREGLRGLLEKQADMEVVAEAPNGREALRLSRQLKPDLVVMDISMPDLNGIDATRQILDEMPKVKVIALSMHADKQFVEGMLRAGVKGYLLKDCASEELIQCIHTVSSGRVYLSPAITPMIVREFVNPTRNEVPAVSCELSGREREVLQMIAEGRSTKEIADALFISVKTVESHRKNIMNKTELHTVAELVKYAIRLGLTSVGS
jgi:two-component system, NarL family, response regulator NreC